MPLPVRKIWRSFVGAFFVVLGLTELLIPRVLNWALGSLFLSVGVIGAILPIMNGTFFLILGLILISFESPYVEKMLHKITNKNRIAQKWHYKLENWLRKYFVKRSDNKPE
jgi:membrane protein implicated in regulation of membrane protease activity